MMALLELAEELGLAHLFTDWSIRRSGSVGERSPAG